MTLLEAAKEWARERGVGYRQRWIEAAAAWELVLHLGQWGDIEVNCADWPPHAYVRAAGGAVRRVATARGMRGVLTSLTVHQGQRLCQSPRHADAGCPACGLARRGAGKRSRQVEVGRKPAPPRKTKPRVLPPDEVLERAPTHQGPRTVEEAEVELERLMRLDAPPEALRAAGARLDALLEKRPLN